MTTGWFGLPQLFCSRPMRPGEILAVCGLVVVWMMVLSWWDLRRGSVPHLLTTYPLVVLGALTVLYTVAGLIRGGLEWAGSQVVVPVLAMSFAGALASDWPAVAFPVMMAAAGVALGAGDVRAQTIAISWLVVTVAFSLGVIRGGDAKVLMLLFAVFPSPQFAIWMMVVLLVGGVQFLVERYGSAAPMLVSGALASLAGMRRAEGESSPLLHWVAVAVVTYVCHLLLSSGILEITAWT